MRGGQQQGGHCGRRSRGRRKKRIRRPFGRRSPEAACRAWRQRDSRASNASASWLRAQILGPVGMDDRVDRGYSPDTSKVAGLLDRFGAASGQCGAEFFQERRASAAVTALRERLQVSARALRDRTWQVIPAQDLVPGDVVRLRGGYFVPADSRVLQGDLRIDQSALTGESTEVVKSPDIGGQHLWARGAWVGGRFSSITRHIKVSKARTPNGYWIDETHETMWPSPALLIVAGAAQLSTTRECLYGSDRTSYGHV